MSEVNAKSASTSAAAPAPNGQLSALLSTRAKTSPARAATAASASAPAPHAVAAPPRARAARRRRRQPARAAVGEARVVGGRLIGEVGRELVKDLQHERGVGVARGGRGAVSRVRAPAHLVVRRARVVVLLVVGHAAASGLGREGIGKSM